MRERGKEYIGDGVYIEDDGFGFWLKTTRHFEPPTNEHRIYLEPEVLGNLIAWTAMKRRRPFGKDPSDGGGR